MVSTDQRKLRETVDLLGFRAQATAVGLVQLSIELVHAGVLDDAAVSRIKDSICGDIMLSRPSSVDRGEYEQTIRRRLDALFAGDEPIGKAPPAQLSRDEDI